MDQTTTAAETLADFGGGEAGAVKRFLAEIDAYKRETEKWRERAKKITKRYLGESEGMGETAPTFNILWSNVETLKPAVYASPPVPEVSRRFKDQDPVARAASMILERALSYAIDEYDFDATMKAVVADRLLAGRGTAWVRYEYQDGDEYGQGGYERAVCDYVYWQDFGHTPARVWAEVNTVWRRAYMTRAELIERFGEEIGRAVALDHKPKDGGQDDTDGPSNEVYAKATVFEMWHKPSKAVYWVAKSYKEGFLDKRPAPLDLKGFFPCPRPIMATTSTDSLVPVPDFVMYQDQAEELDRLTARIHSLQEALKVVGVYDASMEGVERMLNEGVDNELIPVNNWQQFASSGGVNGSVQFMPLGEVVAALQSAYQAREMVKAELYEITGISDILRGQTDAAETATAQGIKAQWGSLRVRDRQKEVQRFARDLIRIKAEVISEMFSPETLAQMVNAQEVVSEQEFFAAVELLRNDRLRGFRVEIETDSTIEPDEQREKQNRVEFLQASGQFLTQAMQVVSAAPEMAPMMSEMMLFGVRAFRAGRQMESVIEQTMQQAAQAAMQRAEQAQQQPDPRVIEMQQKMQVEQAKIEQRAQEAQQKAAIDAQKIQTDAALTQQENQQDYMATIRGQDLDAVTDIRGALIDAQTDRAIAATRGRMQ